MYVIYCLLLWMFVYSLPGLAVFPQLITSPRTAFAIPVISVFVIYCIASATISLGILTTPLAVAIALTAGTIAVLRMRRTIATATFSWSSQDVFIYIFHVILLFPYFIKLGTHAFERGDEIYSWNFWAIQHYFLEPIDFFHTGAPYPQLFPKLLAFCYHIVGDLELQLPVRAMLIVFSWSMLTAIAMAYRQRMAAHLGTYLVLLLYVMAFVGLEQFFDDGYADPIMNGCLLVSVALFWQSQQKPSFQISPVMLGLWSVLCGIAAAHAKQPGLLWVLFSLPVLLWLGAPPEKAKWRYRLLAIPSILGGLAWLIWEGREFHHNTGVIGLSIADRDVMSQLAYSVNKYFIHQPWLFLLFLLAVLSCRTDKILRQLVIIFMIPSLFCWFVFGAYHLRLGQHLIAFAFFVVAASGYALPTKLTTWEGWQRFWGWLALRQKQCFTAIVGISIVMGGLLFVQGTWLEKGKISLYAGGRQSLQRYFGQDADHIYTTVYRNPDALLWVPSRYLYGLFYKHTQLTTPDYSRYATYDRATLIDELQRKLPDYVFTVSQDVIDGPASSMLKEVVKECPMAFEQISSSKNRFSFVTYKVNKEALQQDPCLVNLAKDLNSNQVAFKPT